jgi:hypothetical protein
MGTKAAISGAGSGVAAGSAAGPWGALAGGVLGGLGGLFSDEGGDNEALYREYLNKLEAIQLPSLEELIAAGKLSGTSFDQISEDPATRQATMDALQALKAEGEAGGQSIQSKAAMAGALNQARQSERMQTAAIMDEMARRGQSGGGAEIAARMMANQGAAERAHMGGVQAAADDRTRALNALVQAGNLGSSVRSQDYQKEAQKASARDAIDKWNAENATNAYGNRMGWTFQKAGAQAPAYAGMAGANTEAQKSATQSASGLGYLAGGAAGYLGGGKTIKGYDAQGNPIYG